MNQSLAESEDVANLEKSSVWEERLIIDNPYKNYERDRAVSNPHAQTEKEKNIFTWIYLLEQSLKHKSHNLYILK